jgi:hypothetical protein
MYQYQIVELTDVQMKTLLDRLEKCIDDPHVALHKDEAEEVLKDYCIFRRSK